MDYTLKTWQIIHIFEVSSKILTYVKMRAGFHEVGVLHLQIWMSPLGTGKSEGCTMLFITHLKLSACQPTLYVHTEVRCTGWHSCFVLGRSRDRIYAQKPAIL